jgi:prepilin-type N-terminal cleavage/methylation domain-containing protein
MCRTRRGLTLVEMLIALLLMSVLMAGLWSILDVYSKLFEAGAAKTEQSQVARALMQVISEDLRAAIQEVQIEMEGNKPSGTTVETGSSPTRRFGLFGSATELSIDIVQLTPGQVFGSQSDKEESVGIGGPGETDIPTAPELRTVVYKFIPHETEEDGSEATGGIAEGDTAEYIDLVPEDMKPKDPPGLIRREYTFDPVDPEEEDRKALTAAKVADPDAIEEDTEDMLQVGPEEPAETLTDDFTVTYAPEVLDIRFRYFDGSGWASSWDSIAKKSLPVAVEVTMKLESFDPRDHRPKRLAELQAEEEGIDFVGVGTGLEDGSLEDGGMDNGADASSSFGTVAKSDLGGPDTRPDRSRNYRLIVDLPTAAMHKGTKAASTSALDRMRPPAPRSPAPRSAAPPRLGIPQPLRREGGPTAPKRPSEQWMRTNSPGERESPR